MQTGEAPGISAPSFWYFLLGAQFAFLTMAEQFPELLPEPHQLLAELQVLGDGYTVPGEIFVCPNLSPSLPSRSLL